MLENKFFGEFPRLLFYTDVSQSPALLSNRAVASEKVLCRVLVLLEFSTSLINLHVYSVLAYPLFFFNMQLIRRDSISSSSHQMEVENMADVDYVLCKGSMA